MIDSLLDRWSQPTPLWFSILILFWLFIILGKLEAIKNSIGILLSWLPKGDTDE